MKTRPYVIRQGDYLTKLAITLGFDAQAVWNHADNAALRSLRANGEILSEGDILFIPEGSDATTGLHVGANNRFEALVPTVDVVIAFNDNDGKPRANAKFWLHGVGPDPREDTTDGNGQAKFAVPINVTEVQVVFEDDDIAHNLRVGHLDPVEQNSGVAQRLGHLGFFVALPGSWNEDERLSDGVRRFQRASGLNETGIADAATCAALVQQHGC